MTDIPEKIWKELVEVAKSDGVITSEEEKLLDSIKLTLGRYYKKLDYSDKEFHAKILKDQLQEVIDDAYKTAEDDDMITWDEFHILKKLKNIVTQLGDS
ncbi:MAG: hypothetical protein ACXAD7_11595 [Candidatus Kariarchaeaceae archaeon]|jgi:hypothetical protein